MIMTAKVVKEIALLAAGIAALMFLLYSCDGHPVHAQGYGGSYAPKYNPDAFHPDQALADWFEGLKRPAESRKTFLTDVVSCCDAGDAYPIEIIEEATIDGTQADGRARVKDPSARIIQPADLHEKYRPPLTRGPLEFKYAGVAVVKEKYGNPTPTAWAFLRVIEGEIQFVYCVVQLPPGF